jgi:hypothetical protein
MTGMRGYFRLANLLHRSADVPLIGDGTNLIGHAEHAPTCVGTKRKPHSPVLTEPVADPLEPTYRCPSCGHEHRQGKEYMDRVNAAARSMASLYTPGKTVVTIEELVESIREDLLSLSPSDEPRAYPAGSSGVTSSSCS